MSKKTSSQPAPYFASFEQGLPTLTQKLGYEFNNPNLLKRALTHRSYDSKCSYERLEFLGDALLGVIVAQALFLRYLHHDEGELSRMRATLVCENSLVKIAERLELSAHVILGVGERKGGGRHRASILADVVEALIGAIYLDSDNNGALIKRLVLGWYGQSLDEVGTKEVLKDAKSRLQEWLQGRRLPLPIYQLKQTIGNAPNQTFVVECQVAIKDCLPITERGASRRNAEQKCAELMINQLNKLDKPTLFG